MGGKNHQPCNRPQTQYLLFSTMMSKCVSQSYLYLEQSNIHLEDLLIAELRGGNGSVIPMSNSLRDSIKSLHEVSSSISSLKNEMKRAQYKDLPSFHTFDVDEVGLVFSEMGIVDKTSFEKIASIMQKGTFFEVLNFFEENTQGLIECTELLLAGIDGLSSYAELGKVNLVLEENKEGNIKIAFAKLYVAWDIFNRHFLASSMLSTHLWYTFIGCDSLMGGNSQAKTA